MSQYHVARDGQQLGVYAEQDIHSGLSTGSFRGSDLCWTEGMAEWAPVSSRFTMPIGSAPPPEAQVSPSTSMVFNPYAAPQASSAMISQLKLASRGVRLGAAIIDQIIVLFVMFVPLIPGLVILAQADNAGTLETNFPVHALTWFLVSASCLLVLLIWNAVWLGRYGQSIGKRILGIRVVTFPDGQPAGYAKAFWLRAVVNFVIVNVVPLYGIVDACFIFREDKRCIHDLLAETTVVAD